jgi:cytochrome c oxidase cbb3-type subunit 4
MIALDASWWGHAIGVGIVVMIITFVGIWLWAWLPQHKRTFAGLAQIPMQDLPDANDEGKSR